MSAAGPVPSQAHEASEPPPSHVTSDQDHQDHQAQAQAAPAIAEPSKPSTAAEPTVESGRDHPNPDSATPAKDDNSSSPKSNKQSDSSSSEPKPAGGYDATPIPRMPPGYTLKFTIHRAENLPMADINSLSSDPYVISQIYTHNPTRHKEDPAMRMRTFTIRRNTDPEWNAEWIVANVPASGFKLKCRIYDEDPADHDDRLGNAEIEVHHLDEAWKGITNQDLKIKKRTGSKRAYLVQALATGVRKRKHMDGHLFVSIENLGRTESEHGSRLYTVGPMWFTRHYSPLLGRITGRKTPGQNTATEEAEEADDSSKTKAQKYNFQANQFQFAGPVPAELYHRYVEFRPFVKRMFTHSGLRGFFLHKALMHQHDQIYHFDRSTETGYMPNGPNTEAALKFLELVHFDQGGRIFTYILTLDGLMRFTETGKQFGIDMLSKHTMHSEVALYIAFSGEFFVRRLKHKHQPPPEEGGDNPAHPPNDIPEPDGGDEPVKDPAYYELVIDNDSGTYRPNADLLPKLKEFLQRNLPGLKVVTLDCQKDAEVQQKLKDEQRQKQKEDGMVMYRQTSRGSSISSSDESDLEDMIARGREDPSLLKTLKHNASNKGNRKKAHYKSLAKGRDLGVNGESANRRKEGYEGGKVLNGNGPLTEEPEKVEEKMNGVDGAQSTQAGKAPAVAAT
ncbi:hypothetical protein BT63DRAFT_427727 [Microthyrium microscopicum]|uniref:C2 domain-containing protein n=1 Tax=Microthyrium microscopicum TaxID=703497 RepID=A0A6A6U484_9PEZI|nr:hypothetical protein BT63DRAFT_427727 [Microthyrium microscopicum]